MQRALAEVISREVKDPRVGSVTVTAVTVAPDLSEARVYFLPFAGTHPAAEVLAGLTRASGFLRGEIGRRLGLRHAPRLTFTVDEQFERAEKLTALIERATRHEDEVARERAMDDTRERAAAEPGAAVAEDAPPERPDT